MKPASFTRVAILYVIYMVYSILCIFILVLPNNTNSITLTGYGWITIPLIRFRENLGISSAYNDQTLVIGTATFMLCVTILMIIAYRKQRLLNNPR